MGHSNTGKPDKYAIVPMLYFSTLFLLLSCGEPTDVNEITTGSLIYTNNTNVPAKIINYRGNKKFERLIPVSKSLIQKNSTQYQEIPDSLIFIADSVKVIFNNQKFAKFKRSDNSTYNFLDDKNLTTTFPQKNHTEKKYTFTTADVDNALPCNGNCN